MRLESSSLHTSKSTSAPPNVWPYLLRFLSLDADASHNHHIVIPFVEPCARSPALLRSAFSIIITKPENSTSAPNSSSHACLPKAPPIDTFSHHLPPVLDHRYTPSQTPSPRNPAPSLSSLPSKLAEEEYSARPAALTTWAAAVAQLPHAPTAVPGCVLVARAGCLRSARRV